ncbi:hypothetical protein [Mycolicibacter arupensis]|uniref:Sensor domain-containing protein n=1 Tax=Mycolicibacter arupensis TaxID=342002 RepID=A0A0F5N058_9MYCO|nr:hypothetical protein [Mycolicibacter arupensis]KKC00230.1 hypothetical protein WR43_06070 [Mycolicibacter arupensis]MCV7277961.1 hypothetical protein [Mycolicibacter arupensis]OQZ99928.1 hypothetical protein BST15_06630 [Mycolicibacter arupensis]
MRFNPPPNWPPAPPGWAPDANWAPDPTWPPPPPGWQLWVQDGADVPPGVYPPYGAPWPPPGPEPRSRRGLWLSLGAAGVAIVVALGLVLSLGGRFTAEDKPSRKPDITTLTSEMLVERAAFPDPTGGKWISGVDSAGDAPPDMPNLTVDPPECADFYSSPSTATQTATATLAKLQPGGLRTMRVRLALTPDHPNLKRFVDKCKTFTQTFEQGGRSVTTDIQLNTLDAEGVPPWAVATVITSASKAASRLPISITAATISGYYRGVLVVATSNNVGLRMEDGESDEQAQAEDLVKLFNTQIEKLEAAQ